MRIYFYNDYLYGRGGMETVVPKVCKQLMERGHDVRIILQRHSQFSDWTNGLHVTYIEEEFESNELVNIGGTKDMFLLKEVFKKLPRPDVIVPLDIENILPARTASEVYKKRPQIISWIHLSVRVLNYRENFKYADAHLSISYANLHDIGEVDPNGPIYLVYNPVETDTKYIPRPEIPNFVFLGRLSHQKRLDRFLHALANVQGEWSLQIVGEGDDGPYFMELAEKLGIAEKITWEGWQSSPWDVINEATALLLTSDFEGLPVCIIEANAHGVPVIAGDCPTGPKDMIENGVNGWLYPFQDVVALSSVLQGIVNKEIPLPKMEKVKEAVKDYEVHKVIDRIEQAFLNHC